MAKKDTLENVLKQKIRDPKIIYLLGGGASFCAGLPGIFKLTDLVPSSLRNESRSTFDEIECFLADNGIKNPNIEELLSELYYRLSGAGLGHLNKKRFKTTFEEVCQCIQNTLRIDGPTEYHKEFVLRIEIVERQSRQKRRLRYRSSQPTMIY